jgi:hypothetical protein
MKRVLSFFTKQIVAIVIAVLTGLISGQVLSFVSIWILGQVGAETFHQSRTMVEALFWLVPFLISLCISVMFSILFNRKRTKAQT